MANLKDALESYLDRAVSRFSGRQMADRAKMLKDLGEIGKLNVNAECLMGLNARLVELEGDTNR